MSSMIAEILGDLCEALRGAGVFEAVTVGPDADSARWPRAEVLLISTDEKHSDDAPDQRWTELRASVRIQVRAPRPSDALERGLQLAQDAQEAILADRFRGQRCRDLPIGRATELGPAKAAPQVKPPTLAVSFEVRCPFGSQGRQ